MRTCVDCGEDLVPSTRRVRVFRALEENTPLRVAADECPMCGQIVPADGAVEAALSDNDADIHEPVAC